MKPITEQRQQELISHGNELKERIEHFGHKSDFESKTLQLVEIALASLTAVPTHYIFNHPNGKLFNSLVDESCKHHKDVHQGHTAPPVPVIKLPDDIDWNDAFKLLDIRVCGEDRIRAFMMGANWRLAETKRLNGLGE